MNHQPDPSFHSFLLTREDGSRVYGCAFTFFEQVENDNICAAMLTLSNMFETEQESPGKLEDSAMVKPTGYSPSIENCSKMRKDSVRYKLYHFCVICNGQLTRLLLLIDT